MSTFVIIRFERHMSITPPPCIKTDKINFRPRIKSNDTSTKAGLNKLINATRNRPRKKEIKVPTR